MLFKFCLFGFRYVLFMNDNFIVLGGNIIMVCDFCIVLYGGIFILVNSICLVFNVFGGLIVLWCNRSFMLIYRGNNICGYNGY